MLYWNACATDNDRSGMVFYYKILFILLFIYNFKWISNWNDLFPLIVNLIALFKVL